MAQLKSDIKAQFKSRPAVRVRSGTRKGRPVFVFKRKPNPVIRKVMAEGQWIKRRNHFWFKLLRPSLDKMSHGLLGLFGIYR